MGRPAKPAEQKADTVPVTLRFPRDLHERLATKAAKDERTFLVTVMRAIRSGLDCPCPEEHAERDGVTHGGKRR